MKNFFSRTGIAAIWLRSVGRRLGVNRLVGVYLSRHGYEKRFRDEMLSAIREGDCVWDVGANVGLYTQIFAKSVGACGKVCAFEPVPRNLTALGGAVLSLANVEVFPIALGENPGTVLIQVGDDPIGATSRIVNASADCAVVNVQMATGDALVESTEAQAPNVIKIDTEGFELDVLKGMQRLLLSPILRTLCIEVHFGLLAQRGLADAPAKIEAILEDAGFSCSWVDYSHVVATRNR